MATEKQVTFDPFDTSKNEDVVLVVRSPGTGEVADKYKVGDTFTVSDKVGLNFLAKVVSIDGSGRVKKLVIFSSGSDMDNSAFTDASDTRVISRASSGSPVYTGGTQPSDGKGFSMLLMRGEVYLKLFKDEKPKIATSNEASLISLQSNKTRDKTQERSLGGWFGLDSGEVTTAIDIEEENASYNGKYDLFFHFHSDVGHTTMLGRPEWHEDYDTGDEQYIDLKINPE